MDLTQPGRFVVGANYWASHAGTWMWRDWRPEVVERDFRLLSAAGLQVLRVFPLWPDFQPLHLLRGGGGQPVEFRHGEALLPDDPCDQAGLSRLAMERFGTFLDLAQKYNLKLLVSLLTGWMSGRFHVPPAFEGLNVLTDPGAIRWELRFVRHFVRGGRHGASFPGGPPHRSGPQPVAGTGAGTPASEPRLAGGRGVLWPDGTSGGICRHLPAAGQRCRCLHGERKRLARIPG